MVIEGNLVKTVAWYDNEWGYSCRTAELISQARPTALSSIGLVRAGIPLTRRPSLARSPRLTTLGIQPSAE